MSRWERGRFSALPQEVQGYYVTSAAFGAAATATFFAEGLPSQKNIPVIILSALYFALSGGLLKIARKEHRKFRSTTP